MDRWTGRTDGRMDEFWYYLKATGNIMLHPVLYITPPSSMMNLRKAAQKSVRATPASITMYTGRVTPYLAPFQTSPPRPRSSLVPTANLLAHRFRSAPPSLAGPPFAPHSGKTRFQKGRCIIDSVIMEETKEKTGMNTFVPDPMLTLLDPPVRRAARRRTPT